MNTLERHRAGLGYNYTNSPRYWEPFKTRMKLRSKWLALIRELNFNPVPSLLGFRADATRQFGAFRPRNVGGPKGVLQETYDKFFTFDRLYNLRWDLTRSINVDFSAINRAWVDEDTGRLDKQEKQKMWNNFWDGGRTITYQQSANLTYVLPTSKIPFLDWTVLRVGYVGTYNWLGASLLARNLGNTLSNGNQKVASAELDLTRLYMKSRWLRAVNEDAPPVPDVQQPAAQPDTTGRKPKRDPNAPIELSKGLKFAGKIVMSLKSVSINYTEGANSTIYGYTDSTHILGMSFKTWEPGFGYVFGHQPDTNFVNKLADKGLITRDPNFNFQNRQDYTQRFSLKAQFMPVQDLTIDVNVDKSFGKTYSELYKDTLGTGNTFARLNPYTAGSFSVSYISYKTLFEKVESNEVSETFIKFQDFRKIISQRLAAKNPYADKTPGPEGYYPGYGKYSQEVVLPAFIAAYTGKDPHVVTLFKNENPDIRSNPFSGILPKPNWRITYTGLTRIPAMEKIFTSFTISHGYNSTLSMNSFNSALFFRDPFRFNEPQFIDTLTGNYIPFFLVPNISISEQFSPLIDIDMQFTNQVNARFEYKKSRQLSLSLIDFQLSEARSTEFSVGAGYRKRGLFSWIKWKGKPLDNDAAFQLDFSVRDDATSNSRLDQTQSLPTAGQKVVFINPSIDYVISNRVNIKFYFEQRRVIPKISTAPPITNTRAGMQITISLAQ
jgi:cell surface protein SprA